MIAQGQQRVTEKLGWVKTKYTDHPILRLNEFESEINKNNLIPGKMVKNIYHCEWRQKYG